MADKLNWQNQHYILFRHKYVEELIKNEDYKVPKAYAQLLVPEMSIEDFLEKLIQADGLKEACNLIAYAIHRRAGVWWGFLCMKELLAEPPKPAPGEGETPEAEEDAGGAEEEKEAGETAELPEDLKALKENWEKTAENLAAQEEKMGKDGMKLISSTASQLTPASQIVFWRTRQMVDNIFMRATGMNYHNLLAHVSMLKKEQAAKPEAKKELDGLKEKLDKAADTLAKKPDLNMDFLKKEEDNTEERMAALEAVAEWVLSPDSLHSKKALDCGNELKDTPEGLLALSAYWSYGNLTVDNPDMIIRTPKGLAANGLRMAMLMMILDERGSLSPRDRVLRYLQLGREIAQCRNLWTEDFADLQFAANVLYSKPAPKELTKEPAAEKLEEKPVYTKWG